MRKTINVSTVVCMVNQQLANNNLNADEKKGLVILIEQLLHMCDQYDGFVYLELVPHEKEARFVPRDEYQRRYFMRKP